MIKKRGRLSYIDKWSSSDKIFSSLGLTLKLPEIAYNKGKPSAVNRGFGAVTGAYFTILDADDQLPANSISKRVSVLQSKKAFICCGALLWREPGLSTIYLAIIRNNTFLKSGSLFH